MSRKAQSPRSPRNRGYKRRDRGGNEEDEHKQKSKEPQDWYHYCLYNCGYFLWPVSPTQSITNGDRTDNSDEGSSVRGGYSSGQDRSRSRDGSHERERRDRDGDDQPTMQEPEYNVISTQPRSGRNKRTVPRRHTVGGSSLTRGTHDKGTGLFQF